MSILDELMDDIQKENELKIKFDFMNKMNSLYQKLSISSQQEYLQRVINEECFFDLNEQMSILIDLTLLELDNGQ